MKLTYEQNELIRQLLQSVVPSAKPDDSTTKMNVDVDFNEAPHPINQKTSDFTIEITGWISSE